MIEEIEREDIYEYLEHFGVRGMHWGQRKSSSATPSPGFKNRSAGQKAAIIGVAAASGLAGAYVTRHTKTPIRAIGIGSAAAAGGNAAALLIDQHGKKKVDAPKSKEKNIKAPKQSNKEKRVAQKVKTREEGQKRAESLFNAALNNPNGVVLLNGRQVVTTEEFINHLATGGVMDINSTQVYARREDAS